MPNMTSPVDFLSHHCWGGIKALSAMEQFHNLDRDIEVELTPLIRTPLGQNYDEYYLGLK